MCLHNGRFLDIHFKYDRNKLTGTNFYLPGFDIIFFSIFPGVEHDTTNT